MRCHRECSGSLFSYVSIEGRIQACQPLRRIRKLADQALDRLNPTFCDLYAEEGRLLVLPEQLLVSSWLQVFCGIRSERLFLEELNHNRERRHSTIGCISPIEYEQRCIIAPTLTAVNP
jgi:hypothetical protein